MRKEAHKFHGFLWAKFSVFLTLFGEKKEVIQILHVWHIHILSFNLWIIVTIHNFFF